MVLIEVVQPLVVVVMLGVCVMVVMMAASVVARIDNVSKLLR